MPPSSPLECLQRGDLRGLEAIVRQHGPALLRFLERQAPRGVDSEDLVQDTFLVLLKNARQVQSPERLAAYLRGVARRLALEAARKSQRRRRLLEKLDPPTDAAPPDEPDDELMAALALLDPPLETVIDIYYSRDLTYEQGAALLGISRATFQSRLRRGLAELRRRLGGVRSSQENPS